MFQAVLQLLASISVGEGVAILLLIAVLFRQGRSLKR